MTVVQTNEYDGNHHRVQKVAGTDTIDFYYNDKWQVIVEAKNGAAEAIYAWHHYYIDALAVRFRATDQHYFLHDANFNVTAAYDVKPTSGTYRQVVERYSYTPYGEVTVRYPNFGAVTGNESQIGNQHLFTGRERDPETGLQLNRERYYHPGLGRWLTQDPIGYYGGMNLYMYGDSQPLVMTDPSGLQTEQDACRALCRIACGGNVVCMAACALACVPQNPPGTRPPLPPGDLSPIAMGRCCDAIGDRWDYIQLGSGCWVGWFKRGTCARLCSFECESGLWDNIWQWDGCGDCITPCK